MTSGRTTLLAAAVAASFALIGGHDARAQSGADSRITSAGPRVSAARALSPTAAALAKPRLPMLTDVSQIPRAQRSGVAPQGYGTGEPPFDPHPFTTKGAYSTNPTGLPVNLAPWRSTGKLWMQFGTPPNAQTFVCTASVIEKGLLVTAAHCVQDFGLGLAGSADAVWFEPARHGSTLHFGQWQAVYWYVTTSYSDGTDVCDPTAPGIVCENDVAVVVLNTGPAPNTGKHIAQVVGRYQVYKNNQGYVSFFGLMSTQITQLGYPVAFDGGLKMIRTDSLGYQATPHNVIIGSDQTGGSSGGPWIMNFGNDPVSTNSVPSFNARNRVVGTTSWGYSGPSGVNVKVMGASRFGHNTAFPAPGLTNIDALISAACADYPANCF